MPPYTATHYFLMLVSGVIFLSLFVGIAYLVYREHWKGRQAKKAYRRELLQRRRQAISGRGRLPSDFLASNNNNSGSNSRRPSTQADDNGNLTVEGRNGEMDSQQTNYPPYQLLTVHF